jgi:hypothetical protein
MCFGCQSTFKFFIARAKMSCALLDVHKSKLHGLLGVVAMMRGPGEIGSWKLWS